MPDESTIRKITRRCGPELIEALNIELLHAAAEHGGVRLDQVRVDTTVVEADTPSLDMLCGVIHSRRLFIRKEPIPRDDLVEFIALAGLSAHDDRSLDLARLIDVARPAELTALYLLVGDEQQRRAIELAQTAQSLRWTRLSTLFALATALLATVATVLVAIVLS